MTTKTRAKAPPVKAAPDKPDKVPAELVRLRQELDRLKMENSRLFQAHMSAMAQAARAEATVFALSETMRLNGDYGDPFRSTFAEPQPELPF